MDNDIRRGLGHTVQNTLNWISTPEIGPDHGGPNTRLFSPFPGPEAVAPLIELLGVVARRRERSVAIDEDDGQASYGSLWRSVCLLASELRAHPAIGPVGILLPTGADYVIAVFACLAAERISVLLDASHPDQRNSDILARTGAGLVVTTTVRGSSLDLPFLTSPDPAASAVTMQSAPPPSSRMALDAPAFVLCTSGSTGHPKPIVHSQRTMFHWARTTHNALHVTSDDRVLSLSTPASLGGFTALLSYPLAGACLQMLDIRQSGPRRLLEVLTTKPVSILRAAPSTLRVLTQLPEAEAAFKGLRVVQTYGEPMTRADAAAVRGIAPANCFIRTTYGSTECSGLSWFVSAQDTCDPVHVPAGFLMPDTEAAIVDDFGRSCGPGEAGELLIRSRYNALGEWEHGRVSPGRLTPDASHSGASIYRTGDIARLHSDGVFFVIGRKDRMLKINGQRLDPSEIEEALRKQPDVYRAEVVVDDRAEPARLLAIVVPSPEAHPDLVPRLNKALRAVLPNYMRPSRIVPTSAIPLLPGGKVDRTELLRIATSSVKPGVGG